MAGASRPVVNETKLPSTINCQMLKVGSFDPCLSSPGGPLVILEHIAK